MEVVELVGRKALVAVLWLAVLLALAGCARSRGKPDVSDTCPLRRVEVPPASPLLELRLPVFTGTAPAQVPGGPVDQPCMAMVWRGMLPDSLIPREMEGRSELLALVREVVAGGKGAAVAYGPWYAVWPAVAECLGNRTVLRLYYGRTGSTEPEAVPVFSSGFPASSGLPVGGDGRLLLEANAMYVSPAENPGEDSWLITTAVGLPDARSLSTFETDGYTRTGRVVAIRLEPSPELEALRSCLASRLPGLRPDRQKMEEALARSRKAQGEGKWREAIGAYEEAWSAAGWAAYHDPALILGLFKVRFAAGGDPDPPFELLLRASCVAEQQGDRELLVETTRCLEEVLRQPGGRSDGEMRRFLWQRLTEVRPGDAKAWWALAAEFLPALDVAESVAPAVPPDQSAAVLHLRAARDLFDRPFWWFLADPAFLGEAEARGARERLEQARAHLRRAVELDPGNPYAVYLEGVMMGSRWVNDWRRAAEKMEAVLQRFPDQPDAARQLQIYRALLEGRGAPARSWDLGSPGERYWYSAVPPCWSPDGRCVALWVSRPEPQERGEIAIVDTEGGAVSRVLAAGPAGQIVGWSPAGDWLYYVSGDLKRVKRDGTQETLLAPGAVQAALSPDGTRLVFVRRGLWLVDAAWGSARQLTSGEQDCLPLWCPDGQRVIFAADTGKPAGDGAPHFQVIARVNVDRPAERQVLYEKEGIHARLTWVVPGEVLGVVSGWDDLFAYWCLHADGRRFRAEGLSVREPEEFCWVPGKGFAGLTCSGDADRLPSLRVFDCEGRVVSETMLSGFSGFPPVGSFRYPGCALTGDRLSCFYEGPEGRSLWVCSVEGSSPVLVGLQADGTVSWSPDGSRIAVLFGSRLDVYRVPD